MDHRGANKVENREQAAYDFGKRMGTYYSNSGMAAVHKRGIPNHDIHNKGMRPFLQLKDPKILPNMTYQGLRVLDQRPHGKPRGFKIKT